MKKSNFMKHYKFLILKMLYCASSCVIAETIQSDSNIESSETHFEPRLEKADLNPTEASKQYELGMRYLEGAEGLEKNITLAMQWIERAAMQDHQEAIYELGIRYWKGKGVNQDYSLGEKWLKRAAENSDPMAQMILAEAYHLGEEIPRNDLEAIRLCRILVDAFPTFGVILGDYYADGNVVNLDTKIAAENYKNAAEYGYEIGQLRLAYCYAEGSGVPKSDSDAVVWFRKAADQGNLTAMECMEFAYSNGKGVVKDINEAALWRKRAANYGSVGCQFRVGVHYVAGHGVPKDNVLAYKWLNNAAASGHEDAEEMRDKLAGSMTPDEIAEAQKMSRNWKVLQR